VGHYEESGKRGSGRGKKASCSTEKKSTPLWEKIKSQECLISSNTKKREAKEKKREEWKTYPGSLFVRSIYGEGKCRLKAKPIAAELGKRKREKRRGEERAEGDFMLFTEQG